MKRKREDIIAEAVKALILEETEIEAEELERMKSREKLSDTIGQIVHALGRMANITVSLTAHGDDMSEISDEINRLAKEFANLKGRILGTDLEDGEGVVGISFDDDVDAGLDDDDRDGDVIDDLDYDDVFDPEELIKELEGPDEDEEDEEEDEDEEDGDAGDDVIEPEGEEKD